ncbi:hypothetical protein ACG7TL_003705 [Trametes sanguinea]
MLRPESLQIVRLVPPLPPPLMPFLVPFLPRQRPQIPPLLLQRPLAEEEPGEERTDTMVMGPYPMVKVEEGMSARMTFAIAVIVLVMVTVVGMRAGVRVRVRVGMGGCVMMMSMVVMSPASASPGENPQDGAAVAKRLGMFPLVSAYGTGLLHLAYASSPRRLATQERPAHLGNPAVHRRGLMYPSTLGSLLILIVQV